jgi:hypothetical protein
MALNSWREFQWRAKIGEVSYRPMTGTPPPLTKDFQRWRLQAGRRSINAARREGTTRR